MNKKTVFAVVISFLIILVGIGWVFGHGFVHVATMTMPTQNEQETEQEKFYRWELMGMEPTPDIRWFFSPIRKEHEREFVGMIVEVSLSAGFMREMLGETDRIEPMDIEEYKEKYPERYNPEIKIQELKEDLERNEKGYKEGERSEKLYKMEKRSLKRKIKELQDTKDTPHIPTEKDLKQAVIAEKAKGWWWGDDDLDDFHKELYGSDSFEKAISVMLKEEMEKGTIKIHNSKLRREVLERIKKNDFEFLKN